MLNIGIIGCGKISQVRHLPEYKMNPDATIAAVFDLNKERAEEIGKIYCAKAYDSYETLLTNPLIDAVSICTANNSHAQITIAALEAGKHVLCEKPMATTLKDCEHMTQAAEKCKKILMIDQNQRLSSAHVKAHKLMQSGVIGRLVTFQSSFRHGGPENWSIDPGSTTWFFDKSRAVMGAMADLGVHKTDLLQYLTGETIVEVTARLSTLDKKYADGSPISVDDNAICIYRMNGGAVGTMIASWTDYGPEDNATILYGNEGMLRIYDDPNHTLVLHKKSGEVIYYDVDKIQSNDNQTKSGVIDLFIDCILGRSIECITAQSVLTAMIAVFGAIESSETGCSVSINTKHQMS